MGVGNVMGDAKGLGRGVEVVRYVAGVANSISRKCGALPAALSARGAESLSLACPRESNQREGHPRGRAFRAPALQVRRRATGFFDSTSCADEKLARIPASHPAGFPSPTCRALCGPLAHIRVRTRCQRVALVERRGSCIHAQCHRVAVRAPDAPKGLCSRVTSDRRNAPVAAQDARLLVGAPRGR